MNVYLCRDSMSIEKVGPAVISEAENIEARVLAAKEDPAVELAIKKLPDFEALLRLNLTCADCQMAVDSASAQLEALKLQAETGIQDSRKWDKCYDKAREAYNLRKKAIDALCNVGYKALDMEIDESFAAGDDSIEHINRAVRKCEDMVAKLKKASEAANRLQEQKQSAMEVAKGLRKLASENTLINLNTLRGMLSSESWESIIFSSSEIYKCATSADGKYDLSVPQGGYVVWARFQTGKHEVEWMIPVQLNATQNSLDLSSDNWRVDFDATHSIGQENKEPIKDPEDKKTLSVKPPTPPDEPNNVTVTVTINSRVKRTMTDADRNYIVWCSDYFTQVNKSDGIIAKKMSDLSSGKSTRKDIRAIGESIKNESENVEVLWLQRVQPSPLFAEVDKKLIDSRMLYVKAFNELRQGMAGDGDMAHLRSGSKTWKLAIATGSEAIASRNSAMDGLKEAGDPQEPEPAASAPPANTPRRIRPSTPKKPTQR